MSLQVSISPASNAFTDNPVYLSIDTSSMATYTIFYWESFERLGDIFIGNGNGSFRVNIAEILETLFVDIPPLWGRSELLINLSDKRYNKADIRVKVLNEEGEVRYITFTAWRGGISKRTFRKLGREGTNIFDLKFLKGSGNFFFTTRSNDWRIVLRETELYPLCFIYPEQELKVKELITGKSIPVTGTSGDFYALNIEAIRLAFFSEHGVLANLFDVYAGKNFVCQIGIEESPPVWERYLLRFLNSYGTYELFSLEGKASVSPTVDEDETTVFQRYDEVTDSYYSERRRTEVQEVLTIKTGFKHPNEVRFLADLLASDKVYLIGYGQEEIMCIPSIDEFSFQVKPDEPKDMTLKLTLADKECNQTLDIKGNGYKRPRIHSKEFSKQFN